ncbi:MAG: hypothetical protein ACLVJ6_05790 [Merdibacter sp.]
MGSAEKQKSMRVFEDRAIDEEIKEQLYAAAMEAPSATSAAVQHHRGAGGRKAKAAGRDL